MTSPCFDSGEQDNGQPWPEDLPTRLSDYNTILRQVGSEHPSNTEVYDLGSQLWPRWSLLLDLDGVQIRDADGIHIRAHRGGRQWLDARCCRRSSVWAGSRCCGGRAHRPRPVASGELFG